MNEKHPNKYVEKDRIWNPIEGKWEPRIDCRYRSTESMWESSSVDKMKSAFYRIPTSESMGNAFDSVKEKISLKNEDDYGSKTNHTVSRTSNTVYQSNDTSSYRREQGASEGVSLSKLIKTLAVVVIGVIVFGNIAISLLSSLIYSFY